MVVIEQTCNLRPSSDGPKYQLKSAEDRKMQAYLNVLQRQVLGVGSPVNLELGRFASHKAEDTLDGGYGSIHVKIHMVAEYQPYPPSVRVDTHAPILSARSLARCRVSGDEFSVPI